MRSFIGTGPGSGKPWRFLWPAACLLINLVAFRFVGEPWLDVWDFFAYVPLAVLAILAWEKDRAAWRKASGSAR